jgi:hypothetical protein
MKTVVTSVALFLLSTTSALLAVPRSSPVSGREVASAASSRSLAVVSAAGRITRDIDFVSKGNNEG